MCIEQWVNVHGEKCKSYISINRVGNLFFLNYCVGRVVGLKYTELGL